MFPPSGETGCIDDPAEYARLVCSLMV
jgi:hypothetical protein